MDPTTETVEMLEREVVQDLSMLADDFNARLAAIEAKLPAASAPFALAIYVGRVRSLTSSVLGLELMAMEMNYGLAAEEGQRA